MKKRLLIIVISLVICLAIYVLTSYVIIPAMKYQRAESLFKAGQYEEAIQAFDELYRYKDSRKRIEDVKEAIKERDYNKAEKLLTENDQIGALRLFASLTDYRDSEVKIEDILNEDPGLFIYIAKVGDTVIWGSYEQDNDISDGKEDIEWLVLSKDDKKILVISKYALDYQIYYTGKDDVTWDKCSLRTWLNESFFNEAFNEKEQQLIPTTYVTQDEKPSNNLLFNYSSTTQDKVFALSATMADKYFKSDSDRQCQPTAYVIAQGAYTNPENGCCWWWLRPTVGDFDAFTPAIVDTEGKLWKYGFDVKISNEMRPVRPSIWINTEQ